MVTSSSQGRLAIDFPAVHAQLHTSTATSTPPPSTITQPTSLVPHPPIPTTNMTTTTTSTPPPPATTHAAPLVPHPPLPKAPTPPAAASVPTGLAAPAAAAQDAVNQTWKFDPRNGTPIQVNTT
jgi:hypothetical protein